PAPVDVSTLALHVEFWSGASSDLTLHAFVGGRERELGILPSTAGEWVAADVPLDRPSTSPEPVKVAMQGTSRIVVDHVSVLNANGDETHFIEHGRPTTVAIRYRISDPTLRERAQVVVTFHRDG